MNREDILSLAEDLENGVQRNGSMDGEDGSVDLYDIDAANEVMGEAAKLLRALAATPASPAAEAPGQEPVLWQDEVQKVLAPFVDAANYYTSGQHRTPAEDQLPCGPALLVKHLRAAANLASKLAAPPTYADAGAKGLECVQWQAWRSNWEDADRAWPNWENFETEEGARNWATGLKYSDVRPLFAAIRSLTSPAKEPGQ